jgi:hypothetical protein
VGAALRIGYRHIDTAAMYGNERETGRAATEFRHTAQPTVRGHEVRDIDQGWSHGFGRPRRPESLTNVRPGADSVIHPAR